ncbi:RNA-directed DNA polymerase, eukaryota, reverse transcriptase zinc-binding domain protein [Tanacetum coccineum]
MYFSSALWKWWWRFHSQPEALCRQAISSIHGSCGGFNSNRDSIKGSRLRINIIKAGGKINDIGVPFINSFKRKVISVWRIRIFGGEICSWCREMEELENFDSVTMGLSLQDEVDGWTWSLDTSGSFSVSILRSCIDSLDLSRSDPCHFMEIVDSKKGEYFLWRLIRNRLPTKTNQVDKGIDFHTVLCSFWDDYCESSDHIFIECKIV